MSDKIYIEGIGLYAALEKPTTNFNKNKYEVTLLIHEDDIDALEAKGLKMKMKPKKKAEEYYKYEDRGYDGSYVVVSNSAVVSKKDGTQEPRVIRLYNKDGGEFKTPEGEAIGNGSLIKVEATIITKGNNPEAQASIDTHGARLYLNRAIIKDYVPYELPERSDPLFDGEESTPAPKKSTKKAAKAKEEDSSDFPDDEIPF